MRNLSRSRRATLALVLAAAPFALIGCSGDGNGPTSVFRGAYVGPWQIADGPETTLRLTVARNGKVAGAQEFGDGSSPIQGRIEPNGHFAGTLDLGEGTAILTGDFILAEGALVGELTEKAGGESYTASVTLIPETAPDTAK